MNGKNTQPDRRMPSTRQIGKRWFHRAERKSARGMVSASIIVLLACTMLTVGLGCGFILSQARIPPSLESTVDAGSIHVSSASFDDSQSVTLSVSVGSALTVTSPVSGTVTASTCVPGMTISSGGTLASVDATPLVALHTQTPMYRALTSGMKGADAWALNQALRNLGYAAPDSDTMTWDTITAYNALADSVGAKRLTVESQWTIGPGTFMWLPADSLTVDSCSIAVGQQTTIGQAVFVSAAVPVKATLPVNDAQRLAGDRILTIGDTAFDVPADAAELTDSALLAAVMSSSEYRLATLSGNAVTSSANGSGTLSEGGGGTVNVSYRWKLKQPIDVITVPPSSVVRASGNEGCVVSSGKSVPVAIVSSQLGKTMVRFEQNVSIDNVEIKPTNPNPCR